MGALRTQPFAVTVTTPVVSRSATTNVTTRNFAGGTSRSVNGFFQVMGGTRIQQDTGEQYLYDAVFFTKDRAMKIDDLITLPATFPIFPNEKFLVTDAKGKFGIRGDFSHTECALVRERKL